MRNLRAGLALLVLIGPCHLAFSQNVYVNKTGAKYHKSTCSALKKPKSKLTLTEAKKRKFEPCKKCSPPK